MSKTKSQFDDIKTESGKLRKLWHEEVDSIFDKIDSMNRFRREENLNALQEFHTKIKTLISEMNEAAKQNEKFLKSNKLSEVIKFSSKSKEYGKFPEHLDLQMPIFGSKVDKGKELSVEIGDFRAILKQLPQTSLPADVPCLTKRKGKLIDKVRVITIIPSDYGTIWGVACEGETDAWIYGNKQTITCIDLNHHMSVCAR